MCTMRMHVAQLTFPLLPLSQMRSTREVLETALVCEFVGLAGFGAAHLVLDAAAARVQVRAIFLEL